MPNPIDVLSRNDRGYEVVGFGLAIALIALLRWLLPEAERKQVRQPTIFLLLAFAFGTLTALVGDTAKVARPLAFLYAFFLASSSARSLVILLLVVLLERRTHKPTPRIFRDVIQAIVYVVVAMGTLRTLGVEPGSILTTSALLTAVIGLALQDTLGNMVSGLALQMQRPFDVGDWVQFNDGAPTIGKVTEVNWRATTMITHDMVELIVPNGVLAKAPLRNFSRPQTSSRRMVTVTAGYESPPQKVHEVIVRAIIDTPGVLAEPRPQVVTRNFGDSAIEYSVFYFIDDMQRFLLIEGRVRDRVYYAFQRAGIEFPFPTRTVHMNEVNEETRKRARDRELERRDRALKCVDFFDVLSPEAHRELAAAVKVAMFAPGEIVVREGDKSSELYIIEAGDVSVEVARQRTGTPLPVARLGPGKFFGEMSLMTGEERKATVRAETEVKLLVIDHDAFHDTLLAHPEILERMTDLLAVRQMELEEAALSQGDRKSEPVIDRSKKLISQIRGFFNL